MANILQTTIWTFFSGIKNVVFWFRIWPRFIPLGPIQHHNDVKMGAMTSQITSLTTVYSTVYSDIDQKLRVTGLCEVNSPVTGEFPAQRASNSENIFIPWRHHEKRQHLVQLLA